MYNPDWFIISQLAMEVVLPLLYLPLAYTTLSSLITKSHSR